MIAFYIFELLFGNLLTQSTTSIFDGAKDSGWYLIKVYCFIFISGISLFNQIDSLSQHMSLSGGHRL